jgi:phytoene synthase
VKKEALESLRVSLLAARDTERPGWDTVDPVLVALSDAARRFPLPLQAFGKIVDGCMADVTGRSYDTFEELAGYCRCVAGAVGRLSVGIYLPARLVDAWGPADDLGVALQLTNILRDLREDRLAGRIYLPAEDLQRFGCRLEVDGRGNLTDPPQAFAALVRFEADRAQAWYERGAAVLPLLDRRSAACTAAMAGIYHRLLTIIAADPDAVRGGRVSLPVTQKAAVAARALARGSW